MKIQFDSNQDYQLDAIQAVVDVFDGQPMAQGEFEVRFDALGGDLLSDMGVGNNLVIGEERILQNIQQIQESNEIQPRVEDLSHEMNFSVEMETGTGKTYVYLRSIYELNKTYGFKKFVIVVPSVAIREGVLKNIQLTEEHFRAIYGTNEQQKLRQSEWDKIRCGKAHFDSLDVDFDHVTGAREV